MEAKGCVISGFSCIDPGWRPQCSALYRLGSLSLSRPALTWVAGPCIRPNSPCQRQILGRIELGHNVREAEKITGPGIVVCSKIFGFTYGEKMALKIE